jgi:hypothetical protein
MESYALTPIESDDDVAAYHQIRHQVLFGGSEEYIRNGPEEVKEENLSLLLKREGTPIGTVRLDQKGDRKAIVRLVAIVSGRIEIEIAGARMTVIGSVAPELAQAIVAVLRGRR